MEKTYKFSLTINNARKTFSPTKGMDIGELAPLIQDLKKAIDADDGSFCTLYRISNHGYTPRFITNSKKQFENFISVHQNIEERTYEDLRKKELKYAQTIKSILHKGSYMEPFVGLRRKPIARIIPGNINKPIDSYNVVTTVDGLITEIGSPDMKKRSHVFLDGTDYKVYITSAQDLELRNYYKKERISLKVKQRISIKSNRIISAQLLSFDTHKQGGLITNIQELSKDELSFLTDINSADDILNLIKL
jgi:hypothetical protein